MLLPWDRRDRDGLLLRVLHVDLLLEQAVLKPGVGRYAAAGEQHEERAQHGAGGTEGRGRPRYAPFGIG